MNLKNQLELKRQAKNKVGSSNKPQFKSKSQIVKEASAKIKKYMESYANSI